jgi:hypothetical protein
MAEEVDLGELSKKGDADSILAKISEIIETDPNSIAENKDIFTQVLAAIDDVTLQEIF